MLEVAINGCARSLYGCQGVVKLVLGLHHVSLGVTKENPRIVEQELGLYHESLRVVKLEDGLH